MASRITGGDKAISLPLQVALRTARKSEEPTRQTLTNDVYVEGARLVFDRGPKAKKDPEKLERAKVFLQSVRSEGGDLSFGDHVRGGLDAVGSLRSYYRSLQVANALLEALPETGGGVGAFAEELSIPEDLAPLVELAVGGAAFGRGPLGDVSYDEHAQYQPIWKLWQQGDMNVVQMNDRTLKRYFGELAFPAASDQSYVNRGTPEFKVGVTNLYARALEIGVPLQVQVPHFNAVLPNTPDARKALLRLVAALGQDPAAVQFHGAPLSAKGVAAPKVAAAAGNGVRTRAGRPIGDVDTWQALPNHNGFWAPFTQGQVETVRVNDATVQKFFGTWFANKPDVYRYAAYAAAATPEYKAGLLNFLARAKEIGTPARCQPAHIPNVFNHINVVTPEITRAAWRFVEAYGLDANAVVMAGQRLVDLPRTGGGLQFTLPEAGPAGEASADATKIAELVANKDEALFELDDASLTQFKAANPNLAALAGQSHEEGWQRGLLKLTERCIEIGVAQPAELTALFRAIPANVHGLKGMADTMVRAAYRAKLAPAAQVLATNQNMAQVPQFQEAISAIDGVLRSADKPVPTRRKLAELEAGPLGARPDPQYNQTWTAKDPGFFELTDNVYQTQLHTIQNIQAHLQHWNNDTRVFLLYARLAELLPDQVAAQHIKAWLANPVPAQWVNAESVPRLMRMAQAAGVDLATVRYTDAAGQPQPLLEHPDVPKAPVASDIDPEKAMAEDIKLLNPKSKLHAAEREGAVMRLLFDQEPVHEFDELLPKLLEATASGKLAPVDLTETPDVHSAGFVTDTLKHWSHPGSAILAGLLMKAPKEAVEGALLLQGFVPEQASYFSELAAELGAVDRDKIGFVLAGIESGQPIDFAEIRMRIDFTDASPTPEKLAASFARESERDPQGFVVAVLDRAVQFGADSPERTMLLDFVSGLVANGSVGVGEIRGALGDETRDALVEGALAAVDGSLKELLSAPEASRASALHTLIGAVQNTATYVDPDDVVQGLLQKLYKADLAHVAPLGEADESLGKVEGKSWRMRGDKKDGRVEIAGVMLFANSRGDKDEKALPPATQSAILDAATGKQNLRRLAASWRRGGPIRITGTGRGDADLVAEIAAKLESPYRKLDVSRFEDPMVLLQPEGVIARAAEKGEVVHLTGTLPAEFESGLNGLFYKSGKMSIGGQSVTPDPHFRLVVTSEETRPQFGKFNQVNLRPLDVADLTQILKGEFGDDLPAGPRGQMIAFDRALEKLSHDDGLGGAPVSTGLEQLRRVARRFVKLTEDGTPLPAQALIRREVEEVYVRGLSSEQLQLAQPTLQSSVPYEGQGLYSNLRLVETEDTTTIGDLRIVRQSSDNGLSVDDVGPLELTPRTLEMVYLVGKALQMGEPVALLGDERSGRTSIAELYGLISGRPYQSYLMTDDISAADVLGEAKGQILVGEDFDAAPAQVQRALVAAAEQGAEESPSLMTMLSADSNGTVPDGMTGIRVNHLEDQDDLKAVVSAMASRRKVSEAAARYLGELHGWVVDEYAAGRLGAGIEPDQRPALAPGTLIGAFEEFADLQGSLGISEAYLAAVEMFYPGSSEAELDLITARAKEIAK